MKSSLILFFITCLIMGCSGTLNPENLSVTSARDEPECEMPQIIVTVYFLHVPARWEPLRRVDTGKGIPKETISPQKLEEILSAVNRDRNAKIMATPKILVNNNEQGEVRYSNKDGDETFSIKINNHITLDGRSMLSEVVFQKSVKVGPDDFNRNSFESGAMLVPGYAFALGGIESVDGMNLLLIQPTIVENKAFHSEPVNSQQTIADSNKQAEGTITMPASQDRPLFNGLPVIGLGRLGAGDISGKKVNELITQADVSHVIILENNTSAPVEMHLGSISSILTANPFIHSFYYIGSSGTRTQSHWSKVNGFFVALLAMKNGDYVGFEVGSDKVRVFNKNGNGWVAK